MSAKTNGNKRVIRFGDFIEAAYRAAGSRRAKELVRLALTHAWWCFEAGSVL
jgi:hypothetical protein